MPLDVGEPPLDIPGYTTEQVVHHIRLMADGGLIGYQGTLRGPGGVRISRCRVETPRAQAHQDGMTLRYPYEVRKEDEYFGDIPDEQIPKDMLELA